jgi:hypothetical protein
MSKEPIEYLKHIHDECTYIFQKIPIDFKMKWESINWKNMAGMREKMSQLSCSCGIHAFPCYKDIAALPLRWQSYLQVLLPHSHFQDPLAIYTAKAPKKRYDYSPV